MRLIDADALTKKICDDTSLHYRDTRMLLRYIAQAKTITAYAEVVHCKDCVHHFYDSQNDCWMCHEHEYGETYGDYDFCSYGERKGGEDK